jgi:hypothetical protein
MASTSEIARPDFHPEVLIAQPNLPRKPVESEAHPECVGGCSETWSHCRNEKERGARCLICPETAIENRGGPCHSTQSVT